MDFEKTRSQNTSILREYKKVHAELKKLKEGMNSENLLFANFANKTFNPYPFFWDHHRARFLEKNQESSLVASQLGLRK